MADGHGVVAERLGHHGVHGDAFFQRIVLHQAEVFVGDTIQAHLRLATDQVVQRGETLEILLEKAALDTLAAQTQVAHRFEIEALFLVAAGAIGHFKQRVVGVVEQLLQGGIESLSGAIPDR